MIESFKEKQSAVISAMRQPNVRFCVLVTGRRFGKTHIAVFCMLQAAAERAGCKSWYIGPTYRQSKEVVWDIMKKAVPREWIKETAESDLKVRLHNGSELALKGADKPDSLRGPDLYFAAFDEYAEIDPNTWHAIIRPTLTTSQGKALFIGTPRGYDHLRDLFVYARDPYTDDADLWRGFQFTSIQGGYIPLEEVELARRETDPRIFRQEYEASFETFAGKVYYAFNREINISRVQDRDGPILVGMDFNVNPMSAVIGQRVGDQLHIIDEVVIPDSNTTEMATEIKNRYGGVQYQAKKYELLRELGKDNLVPTRPIDVYPDPSGNARKTSAPVGQTDYTILRNNFGFNVIAPKKAPMVQDRINNVNSLLKDASGKHRLFIDPKCKELIKCLDGLAYKRGTNLPDKGSGLDHLPDALGYLVWSEFPMLRHKTHVGEL